MEPNKRPVINIWLMVGSTISFVWAGIILFFSALFFYVGTKANSKGPSYLISIGVSCLIVGIINAAIGYGFRIRKSPFQYLAMISFPFCKVILLEFPYPNIAVLGFGLQLIVFTIALSQQKQFIANSPKKKEGHD